MDELTTGASGGIGGVVGTILTWITFRDKINEMKKNISEIYKKLDILSEDVAFIKGKMNQSYDGIKKRE